MKRKDDTKRTKMLDAAAEIILQEGAAAISTIKVAKAVGVAQSNVYLYFKNKNDLLLNTYQRELSRIRSAGDTFQYFNDAALPIEQRVESYVHSIYDYAIEHPDSLTLIEQIKMLNLSEMDLFNTDTVVIDLITEAIQQGYLKNLPVNLHMVTVFNIMHRHALNLKENLYSKDQYSYKEISQMVLDAIKATKR
ncbi:TetR/AcrR family transcriptional regulator [Enterococcus devriesei]|uniref:HTH tetR-type domain-containing protein n=1 Tax=Enterococcus devriesei TaxID=319970 RepID=A0A1L8SXE4_9ENTE|nr:TetR/AcrR family transcriptional regulator [Enterococcus devriesei]OJG36628.1 hypothetical protein RV00_GL001073 [Enterococcus devriesei]